MMIDSNETLSHRLSNVTANDRRPKVVAAVRHVWIGLAACCLLNMITAAVFFATTTDNGYIGRHPYIRPGIGTLVVGAIGFVIVPAVLVVIEWRAEEAET
jgi:hypothetical protein